MNRRRAVAQTDVIVTVLPDFKRKVMHVSEKYPTDLFCRCSLFIVCIFCMTRKKQRCVLCELLTVCHRFRSNVSYRLLCDVLKQSASPFRYTVEKKDAMSTVF